MALSTTFFIFLLSLFFGWMIGNFLVNGKIFDFRPYAKSYYYSPLSQALALAIRVLIVLATFLLSVFLFSLVTTVFF
jgi:hypothetical protein